jgi:ubiquinone/menaquinone biosynthesis C-methylase UbiE
MNHLDNIHSGTELLTLDVGCGEDNKGSIGIDLRRSSQVDVICDAHHLPFAARAFDVVYCFHVLEHCNNPYQVLAEIKRVTKSKAVIKVPNLGVWDVLDSSHMYSWSKYGFEKFLKCHFNHVKVGFGMRILKLPYRYTSLKSIVSIIDYIATYVLLHIINNELMATCLQ